MYLILLDLLAECREIVIPSTSDLTIYGINGDPCQAEQPSVLNIKDEAFIIDLTLVKPLRTCPDGRRFANLIWDTRTDFTFGFWVDAAVVAPCTHSGKGHGTRVIERCVFSTAIAKYTRSMHLDKMLSY